MSANLLRIPDDLTERYKATAKVLNAELAQKGIKPIKPTELMRIVMARVVGLPVSHDVEIDAVTEAAKKAPAKQAKRTSKKAPPNMTTRPHGGKTAAKRTSKKAPPNMTTRPHGG